MKRNPKISQDPATLDALEGIFERTMSGTRTRTPRRGRFIPFHTRGGAGELDAIVKAQRDPNVVGIRVVPQQSGSKAARTPDLHVDVRMPNGRIETQQREIRSLTGAGIGWRRVGTRGPVTTTGEPVPATPDAVASAIRSKIFPTLKQSQIAGGGDLVIQIRRGGADVDKTIAAAVNQMNPRLAGARFVRELQFHVPGKRVVRYVRARNGTFVLSP